MATLRKLSLLASNHTARAGVLTGSLADLVSYLVPWAS
jgi:hypothetical protein